MDVGVQALGISLDGPDAETHDAFRGWTGSFDRTLRMLQDARELAMPVQVNTTITRRNFAKIDAIAEMLSTQGIAMWSAFFLVPVGRGVEEERIKPEEYEIAFDPPLASCAASALCGKDDGGTPLPPLCDGTGRASVGGAQGRRQSRRTDAPGALGVTDGKGVMFVSHTGEIFPAGFLPLCCGRFPHDSVIDVYQNHPTFRMLRDPDQFKGICGICEYRQICGGSRAGLTP